MPAYRRSLQFSLAGNVAIEHPAIELAFESGEGGAAGREFFQAFVRPEGGDFREARRANHAAIGAVYDKLNASPELTHYLAHYHEERNHQGLQNRLLKCSDGPTNSGGRVERRDRLGGMLNFYHREAA